MLASLRKLFALVLVLLLGVGGYAAWYALAPIGVARFPAEFQVVAGSGLRATARQIETSGIPVGRLQFEMLTRLLGKSREIKAGSYELTVAVNPLELLDKITRGDVTQGEIALIEGWTFRQFRAAMAASHDLRGDSRELPDADILKRIGAPETHPEGLFFPDTYLFGKGSSDFDVFGRAYRTMQRKLAAEWAVRDPKVPFATPHEALIMASIVEKETGSAAERSMIAGVLVNRLRIGMRLQADPTVIYGLGATFDGNLRKRDLLADGPYNSYMRAGLPPTPIAMPGLASLRATMHPAETQAVYYVSRGDGTSQFSRTIEEHNRAVSKFQLKR
ncbi:MAG: endolytic transglycosylase MltG [Betaproteobacteria bacterium]